MLLSTIKFDKDQRPKLNSHHQGHGGKLVPVYISEQISPVLYAAARRKAREAGYKFVCIKDGHIYTRKGKEY